MLIGDIEGQLDRAQISVSSISITHVRSAGLITAAHRDPFDRLLAAQAITEGLTLVTSDVQMASLGAPCLW